MTGRGSKARRIRRLKKSGEYKIEWYRPHPAKQSGICTRCNEGFEEGSMVNGDFKWPMHVPCWDDHLKERRP